MRLSVEQGAGGWVGGPAACSSQVGHSEARQRAEFATEWARAQPRSHW